MQKRITFLLIVFVVLALWLCSCKPATDSPCSKTARAADSIARINKDIEKAIEETRAIVHELTAPTTTQVVEEEPEVYKSEPVGKFSKTERVCLTDARYSGVILSVEWSYDDPDIIVYEVEYYDGETYTTDWFYETQLTAGDC